MRRRRRRQREGVDEGDVGLKRGGCQEEESDCDSEGIRRMKMGMKKDALLVVIID